MEQLQPEHNARHPDPREVAADRLFRVADALLQEGGSRSSADLCLAAAQALAGAVANDEIRALEEIGAVVRSPAEALPSVVREERPLPSAGFARPSVDSRRLAVAVVESVCRTGSLDLGDNMGVDSAGVGLDVFLAWGLGSNGLEAFDRWIADAESRVPTLLERRIFSRGPRPTLEDVGDDWGLTRERVRQVESKTRETIERTFGRALRAAASPLQRAARYVMPAATLDLLTDLLAGDVANRPLISAALREYSGPWIEDGDWTYHETLQEQLASARSAVVASGDEYGLLADDAPSHLDGLFAAEDHQLNYFRSALGIVQLSGAWSARDSLRARIAAALRHIGRPATKSEIAETAGLEAAARVGSTLSALEGIVRADKDRWAFAAWVDDPYDGIVGEINQRIDAHSGSVAVALLLDGIPRKFGVSENSVMMYLQTPAYVLDEGFVRHAEAGEFNAAPPSKWADAFHVDGVWGQQLQVEQRHLDGYSLKVRFDIAYANGLRPGCDLRVPIEGTGQEASVIWRAHDASWGIDVGRVSQALVDLAFAPGDLVLVIPSPTMVGIREPLAAVETVHDAEEAGRSDPLLDLLGDG